MRNYRYKERRNHIIQMISFWIGEIVCVIALAYVVIQFGVQTTSVYGASMQPEYQDGDTVIVNKLAYRLGSPNRLDVAVFEITNGTNTNYMIKRVVGIPGDRIQITDSQLYVNGEPSEYHYTENILSAGLASYEITLGEDEYFVMGDNCNNSEDSRSVNIKNIKKNQFIGKIIGKI